MTTSCTQLLPPAVAIIAMIVISVANTQALAAFLFGLSGVAAGYTLWSVVVGPVVLVPVFLARPSCFSWLEREGFTDFAILCVFRFMEVGGTFAALASISTALEAAIGSTKPVVTILLESLVLLKLDHWLMYVVVAGVAVGDAMAATGAFVATSIGIVYAVAATVGAAGRYVFSRRLLVRGSKALMHPTALLFWMDLALIVPCLIWAAASGSLQIFFGSFATLGLAATGLAALNCLKSISECVVLLYVSAASMSVASVLVPTINILLSLLVTQTHAAGPLTATPIAGIAMIGTLNLVYVYLRVEPRALPAVDRALGCCERQRAGPAGEKGEVEEAASKGAQASEDTPLKAGRA